MHFQGGNACGFTRLALVSHWGRPGRWGPGLELQEVIMLVYVYEVADKQGCYPATQVRVPFIVDGMASRFTVLTMGLEQMMGAAVSEVDPVVVKESLESLSVRELDTEVVIPL